MAAKMTGTTPVQGEPSHRLFDQDKAPALRAKPTTTTVLPPSAN
jgi:hypothetical protein